MGFHMVTGAFGYTGKYIAERLLNQGKEVRTLTGSPQRANLFGGKVQASPFNFHMPDKLASSLRGADVLYNTYWVRFNHGDFSYQLAIDNTRKLFWAAYQAGVRRVVHVSITNALRNSDLEYFSGKARLERALMESGLSYAILRPAVLFGPEDILINNIAWILRRFPLFGMPGSGNYKVQPIYVDDLAELAVAEGEGSENSSVDAIGPETFTFRELVQAIAGVVGKKRPIIPLPPVVTYLAAAVIGRFVNDVILTNDEITGLTRGLLATKSSPVGKTKFTEWARENAALLGVKYASELARRHNRKVAYQDL